jgi:hypothetical protein
MKPYPLSWLTSVSLLAFSPVPAKLAEVEVVLHKVRGDAFGEWQAQTRGFDFDRRHRRGPRARAPRTRRNLCFLHNAVGPGDRTM